MNSPAGESGVPAAASSLMPIDAGFIFHRLHLFYFVTMSFFTQP
jgi:hypothetical protein